MVLTKLLVVAALGVSMVGMWHLYNVGSLPPLGLLVKNAIITLPFYPDVDSVYPDVKPDGDLLSLAGKIN